MRVTQNMWHRSLMDSINRSYERMASIDMRRRIVTASDDPAGTERLVHLRALLSRNEQYQENVASASRWLEYTESGLASVTDSLHRVKEIALTAADDGSMLDGLDTELDAIIQATLNVANGDYGGRYIFAGSTSGVKPFELVGDSVLYHGDELELSTAISSSLSLRYNVPGSEVFTPREAYWAGSRDWDAAATWGTPLAQLFDGKGMEAGMIRIVDGAGTSVVVDLRGSATLADLKSRIEAALPAVTVDLVDGARLAISDTANPTGSVHVEDLQGGATAALLGIGGSGQGGSLLSRDLDPALSDATALGDLRGLTLPLGSIGIRVGDALTATELDLSGAATVGDLRSLINGAFPELEVAITASGDRLGISGTGLLRFAVEDLPDDASASALGLVGEAYPNRPLGLLLDLKAAVESGDREAVRQLLPEIDVVQARILAVRASVGTRLNLAEDTLSSLGSRNVLLTESLSEVGDVDMAQAILMYQNAESVYQASLLLASNIYQLTLANYL